MVPLWYAYILRTPKRKGSSIWYQGRWKPESQVAPRSTLVFKKYKKCSFKTNRSFKKLLYFYLVNPLEEKYHELYKACNIK